MNPQSPPTDRSSRGARGMRGLLWLAAVLAWIFVAVRAWSQTRKVEARKHTFRVSDRLLDQVFPNGFRRPSDR
jgi:hypothetical protein